MITILTPFFLIAGSFFIMLAALGILKFPDLYTRMHAASKAVSFGSGLMLLATVLYFKSGFVALEAILIILFIFLTTPVASHMISRVAYLLKIPLWEKSTIDELKSKSWLQDPPSQPDNDEEKDI